MPTVSGTVTDSAGHVAPWSASWTVESGAPLKLIGMSAPASEWANRVAEVGTQGLKARRIFADLTSSGQDQASLISAAHAAGMCPIVSYKVPSFTNAATGAYDTWADATAAYLASFDKPTAVTIWHEPNGDMTGPQFVAMHQRLMPKFKGVGQLKCGPILNGFLLTQPSQPAGVNEFTSYTSPTLMDLYDWFGIDTYQPGTQTSPGSLMPHERVYALLDWLADQGKPDMPIGVGEYNGFSAAAISGMGEALLSTPNTLFGCVWNVDQARAGILTGARLTAYRATKADPRAQQ